ncbi:MAG: cysteine hydrolase [Alphaproteobacteria bacterium]|nr:cysteine hydrolase [Alphaproteobacteria bacterium]
MTELTVECWAGRKYTFDPARTALLVIDMQRHFLEPVAEEQDDSAEGVAAASAEQDAANATGDEDVADADAPVPVDTSEIIPRVARLLALARRLGCMIVHTREGYSPDLADVSAFRHDLGYVGHPTPLGLSLIRGEPGHDFVQDLLPLPGEAIIDKASFGAFYQTELHDILQDAGIDHLILAGVTTQCCVHSTLREAVDRGYWCLTVADCCAASEEGLHEAALIIIAGEGHLFGWICDVEDLEAASTVSV